MKQQIISYNQNNQSFRISCQFVNIDSEDAKKTFKYIFDQYKIIQDQLQNKFPYSNYLKVAKIEKVDLDSKGLNIQYYYEGLDGEKLDIPYIPQEAKIDEGFKLAIPLASSEQEQKNLDIPILKSVLFNLIEIFYWSANFGLFLDPIQDCLYYYQEQEQFLLLPTFTLMTKYLFQSNVENVCEKFIEFRCKLYQNATYNFLFKFYFQFKLLIKETDEDQQFFKEYFKNDLNINNWESLFQIQDQQQGCDYLYKDERFQKKLPRTKFRSTMLLYQLQNNLILKIPFIEYCKKDSKLITEKEPINTILNKQFNNLIQFFFQLPQEFESQSLEIFGQFMSNMQENLKSKNIDTVPYPKVSRNIHKINIQTLEQNKKIQIEWSSQINKNIQQNQQMIQENLIINYIFIQNQSSIIIKTQISEIQFSIDTADDIIYLANMLIREPTAINIYVDESRKLTLSTSIQMASPMEIFKITIKIFDMLQIYYHMILDFYRLNIQQGRSIKDKKYQLFVHEIQHYVQDYEIDFDQQIKNFDRNNTNKKEQ